MKINRSKLYNEIFATLCFVVVGLLSGCGNIPVKERSLAGSANAIEADQRGEGNQGDLDQTTSTVDGETDSFFKNFIFIADKQTSVADFALTLLEVQFSKIEEQPVATDQKEIGRCLIFRSDGDFSNYGNADIEEFSISLGKKFLYSKSFDISPQTCREFWQGILKSDLNGVDGANDHVTFFSYTR